MVSFGFPVLNAAIGMSGTFFLFAGFAFIGLVFCFLLLPRTKETQNFDQTRNFLPPEEGQAPAPGFRESSQHNQGLMTPAGVAFSGP